MTPHQRFAVVVGFIAMAPIIAVCILTIFMYVLY